VPDSNTGASTVARTSEGWHRVAHLLEQALARDAQARLAFLQASCEDDPDLVGEIMSLVEAQSVHSGPLEALAAAMPTRPPDAATDGIHVGPYFLVRELGRGGMGVVYLARRADGQYTRDVALKLAQSPLFDAGLRERFIAERDILARLSHRNIAALFDGGVTDEGHPYFTMELVDGRPIDVYCEEERLPTRERVRLFLQICDAVSAAHRCLVVHRDLKPKNVLVSGTGDVKLLDFGIAKLLDPLHPRADETRAAARLFTRDYASPEQVRGEPVTTASDVYSLGGILYRLITGRGPHQFDHDTPAHVEHVICTVEPEPPGVDDDLDNVVIKALCKDQARRYASVEQLAQDLDHYLRGLPVSVQADCRVYRARRFVARHRFAVAAALVIAVSLLAGTVGTMIQAQRAHAAAARAQRVSMLLTDLFKLAEPGQLEGGKITAQELLDRGARRIAVELVDDPEAQATMYGVIGRLYRNLALNEPAGRALERALELRGQVSGTESLAFAEALNNMADLKHERGEYAPSEGLYKRALALQRRHGAPPRDMAASLEGLGRVLSSAGRHVEAEAPLREALDLRRRYGGERGTELVEALHELALNRLRQGNNVAGEPLFREAVALSRRLPASSVSLRVSSLVDLARLRRRFERKPAEAEGLYREALELTRRWYPSGHPDAAVCLSELASTVRDLGKLEEAEALAVEALAMWKQLRGPEHRDVIIATQRVAGIVAERGRPREAEMLFRQAFAASRDALGEGHPLTLSAHEDLATFLQEQGRLDEATALRESNLAAALRAFGENHVYVARAWAALGSLHAVAGDYVRAEEGLRRALDVRRKVHPAGNWRIAEAETALGAFLTDRGRHAEAEVVLVNAVKTFEQDEVHKKEREEAARQLARARDPRMAKR
jgi:eukaryotic-like serine/threonine-protein kinase